MNILKQFIPTFIKNGTHLSSDFIITPQLTITGNRQIHLENQYTLQSFSSSEIILSYHEGEIHIQGEQLLITALYPEEIILSGRIKQVIFEVPL